jgi:GMP synthase PP-ATPase subunit
MTEEVKKPIKVALDPENILEEVRAIIKPYGCEATGLGPDSVGVQGDGRIVGPVVYVTFPPKMSMDEVSRISTDIINRVKGLTRVMMNIPTA